MKHHSDLRAAIARAVARAKAVRRSATVYDLFGALVETPEVHLMVHQTGGDADVLASGLHAAAAGARGHSIGSVIALAISQRAGAPVVGPGDVFAAGFDAGDTALVIMLEGAGLSRTRVLQWLSGDPEGLGPSPEPYVPRVHGGFFAALVRQLTWRVPPPGDVSSSDGVIAVCGMVALATWLAFDRYSAGASAMWYPAGVAGVTWYAAGAFALAWVLHRVSGAFSGYRSVLAPIVGWIPLALAVALAARTWGVALAYWPCVILLACLGLVHAIRVLVSIGSHRPRAAIAAGAIFIGVFAWGTEHAYVNPEFWFGEPDDDEGDTWTDSERLIFAQPDRVDAAAARLGPAEPDRPSVFFVGFAGMGEQKVFAEETKLAARVIAERYGAASRTLLLLNDRRDRESSPFATVSGLARALARLGKRMDPSKDVLFLFLTSHGSAEPALSVSNSTWPLTQLKPSALREALDASGIKWRVIVISACYSGAFIPELADDQTAIFTSAAADRTSFGCSDDREMTEFGEAFIRDAVPAAPSLWAAFEQAKVALASQEQKLNLTESLPQARIGAAIATHWDLIEAQHGPAAAKGR